MDSTGNLSSPSAITTFVCDKTPPIISAVAEANGHYTTDQEVEVSANEDVTFLYSKIRGMELALGKTSVKQIDKAAQEKLKIILDQHDSHLSIKAKDKAGNFSTDIISRNYVIEKQAFVDVEITPDKNLFEEDESITNITFKKNIDHLKVYAALDRNLDCNSPSESDQVQFNSGSLESYNYLTTVLGGRAGESRHLNYCYVLEESGSIIYSSPMISKDFSFVEVSRIETQRDTFLVDNFALHDRKISFSVTSPTGIQKIFYTIDNLSDENILDIPSNTTNFSHEILFPASANRVVVKVKSFSGKIVEKIFTKKPAQRKWNNYIGTLPLDSILAVAIDSKNNVYFSDRKLGLFKIDNQGKIQAVITIKNGKAFRISGLIRSMLFDTHDNLFMLTPDRVSKMDTQKNITVVAGGDSSISAQPVIEKTSNLAATSIRLNDAIALDMDKTGALYIAERNRILKILPDTQTIYTLHYHPAYEIISIAADKNPMVSHIICLAHLSNSDNNIIIGVSSDNPSWNYTRGQRSEFTLISDITSTVLPLSRNPSKLYPDYNDRFNSHKGYPLTYQPFPKYFVRHGKITFVLLSDGDVISIDAFNNHQLIRPCSNANYAQCQIPSGTNPTSGQGLLIGPPEVDHSDIIPSFLSISPTGNFYFSYSDAKIIKTSTQAGLSLSTVINHSLPSVLEYAQDMIKDEEDNMYVGKFLETTTTDQWQNTIHRFYPWIQKIDLNKNISDVVPKPSSAFSYWENAELKDIYIDQNKQLYEVLSVFYADYHLSSTRNDDELKRFVRTTKYSIGPNTGNRIPGILNQVVSPGLGTGSLIKNSMFVNKKGDLFYVDQNETSIRRLNTNGQDQEMGALSIANQDIEKIYEETNVYFSSSSNNQSYIHRIANDGTIQSAAVDSRISDILEESAGSNAIANGEVNLWLVHPDIMEVRKYSFDSDFSPRGSVLISNHANGLIHPKAIVQRDTSIFILDEAFILEGYLE